MNSKTRIGQNSERSSSAPPARFSGSDEQKLRLPVRVPVITAYSCKKFGQKVQALRQQMGLSYEQLSKECGITVTKLKMIEAGQAEPRLFTVISLAEKLRTRAEELLREIE